MPKYDVDVQLSGQDGNAFMVIGRVRVALKSIGVKGKELDEFSNEAMSGDYDHLLTTCAEWVNVS